MWLVTVAVLVVVGAVTAGTVKLWPKPTGPEAEPVHYDEILAATLTLPRLAGDPDAVAVRIENHGDEPVLVVAVELLTASFEAVEPTEVQVSIPPEQAKWILVDYGPGVCGGDPAPALAPTSARIVVAEGERRETVEFELPDAEYQGLGTRLNADCSRQMVSAAVDLRLTGWTAAADGTLRANLTVARRAGDEPLAFLEMRGSVLYRLEPPTGEPFGVVTPDESLVEIPVTARPGRCDPHALADVKFPYQFRTWLTIGDSEQLVADIATDLDGQERLLQMWHTVCGL